MTLPKPYYEEGQGDRRIVIYHGDCRDILPELPADSVDLVLTDPPYMIGLNYEGGFDDRWNAETFVQWHRLAMNATSGPLVWFGAATRVHRDMDDFVEPPQRILIWAPRFSLTMARAQGIMYRWHPIYCWRLPTKHRGPNLDVLRYQGGNHCGWSHPGTKPLPLILRLVGFCPDGTVCDPFLGSGTTLVAAKQHGCRAIGIEIDERYCEIAARRLAQGVFDWGKDEGGRMKDEQEALLPVSTF